MKKLLFSSLLFFLVQHAFAQNVGVGTTTPKAAFNVASGKTVLFGSDTSGAGSKLIWYPVSSAFRAGNVPDNKWDAANVGQYSIAMGFRSIAEGAASLSVGDSTSSFGQSAVALGYKTNAEGGFTTALGAYTSALGYCSVAAGNSTFAGGYSSTAMGYFSKTEGAYSTAIGANATTKSGYETALGRFNTDYIPGSSSDWVPTDRLLVVGNGISDVAKSDALVILKNGNVGIGTNFPAYPLSFAGPFGDKISLWGNGDNTGNIGFGIQPGLLQIHSNQASDDIAFGYGSSSNFTEQMRIKGNGNVGIGTSNPFAALHVKNTSSNPVIIEGGDQLYVTLNENGTNVGYIGSYAGNQNDIELGTYGGNTTGSVILTTNNSPKLTVANNGNVGIGTSTPAEKLEVAGKIKTGSLQITNGAANGSILTSDGSGNASWTIPAGQSNYWSLSGNNIYNNTAGNVGIGTNAPATTLHVKSTLSNPVIIEGGNNLFVTLNENGTNVGYIGSYAGNPTDMELGTYSSNTNGSVILSTGNTPRITVINNGNTGIGTSSPAAKLQVDGAIRVQGAQTTHAQGLSIEWNNSGGSGASYLLNQKGLGGGGFVLGEIDNANSITHRFDIDPSGNVGIGNSTPKSTLDINGTIATKVTYRTGNSGPVTLDNSATVWIFGLNINTNIVLPSSFDCPNRRYTIANRNNTALAIDNYFNLSGTLVSSIPAFSSIELVSGGAIWEQLK